MMSDDLIKREDAIKALKGREGILHDAYTAVAIIRAVPSADRPQGEWIEQEDCWQCSECGDEYVLDVDVKPIDARMHYCPNCGAHMKGADNE
jgi:hypothetical protein